MVVRLLPAQVSATKANGSSELPLALSDRGIVERELLTICYMAHGV